MLNGSVQGHNVHGDFHNIINNYNNMHLASESRIIDPNARGSSTEMVTEERDREDAPGCLSAFEKKEMFDRLRFEQLDARLFNLRKAQSKTCGWVTRRKDYCRWFDAENLEGNDGFFWIKGNPGTGKSITMKFLYQNAQRRLAKARAAKEKLVISFFFNARGDELEKSTLGLYRSLLFNLLTLEPNLQDALNHYGKGGYHNVLRSGWQVQMLKEVLEEAVLGLQGQNKELFCYIDALDECPEDEVQDMISYFEDLVGETNSRNFRVL